MGVIVRKLYVGMVVSAALCAVAVVATWLWFFHSHEISRDGSDWADFAAYFGDLMTPIVALLSLIAFLRTLSQQQRQRQIDSLETQSRQGVLFRIIEKLDAEIIAHLEGFSLTSPLLGPPSEQSALRTLSDASKPDWELPLPPRGRLFLRMLEEDNTKLNQLFHCLDKTVDLLKMLERYVTEHDSLEQSDDLSTFYRLRYGLIYHRLADAGWLKRTSWAEPLTPPRDEVSEAV